MKRDIGKAAKVFMALSEPARLDILRLLAKNEGCVSFIQLKTGRPQPNVSQHLRVLRDCGLVSSRKEGKKVCYCVRDEKARKLIGLCNELEGE